jgi:hypothetical protein
MEKIVRLKNKMKINKEPDKIKKFKDAQRILENFLREIEAEYTKEFFVSERNQLSYAYELANKITIICNDEGCIGFINELKEEKE